MSYNKIRKMDISNGEGIRVSIFFQGCEFHCEGCFNPETWNPDVGIEFTQETIDKILNLCNKNEISGLSILGGEPLHIRNIENSTKLAKQFKSKFPNKTIWMWTGNLFENIHSLDIFKYIDVLVDGQFKCELRNPNLHWRGSENQRVINVQKSLEKNEVVLYEK